MKDPVFLTIAHNVFLNREERYRLSEPDATLPSVGVCLPVWVRGTATTEPGEEVVCRYQLVSAAGEQAVGLAEDGFLLRLDPGRWAELRDVRDGGVGSLYFTHQGLAVSGEREVLVLSYVNVQGVEALRGTDG